MIEQVELERIRMGISQMVDEHWVDSAISLDDHWAYARGYLELRIRGSVWGERHPPVVVSYPKTWWDAFKVDCFPDWAMDRWPPVYVRREISFTTAYPDFRPNVDSCQSKCVIYKDDGEMEFLACNGGKYTDGRPNR